MLKMLIETAENRELRAALWRAGHDLGLAWYAFGDEREKRLHDERRGTGATLAFRKTMGSSLFGRISSGEFVALGFRTHPTVSDGPVVVPADVFDAPMGDEWEHAVVHASGWRYERVAILTLKEFGQLTNDPVPAATTSEPVDPPVPPPVAPTNRPGRKSTYQRCVEVFDHWARVEPRLLDLSAEKLEGRFKADYAWIHAATLKDIPAPNVRTIRKHLQTYVRQKSAIIGKNEIAN